MSAKWRALQHRHRYTYSAVVFPRSYIESLTQLLHQNPSSKFYSELIALTSLNSTYAQVNHVKKVASAFGELLAQENEISVSDASWIYLELLFFENSFPLHRNLVSVLAKSRNFHSLVGGCFRKLCITNGNDGSGKGKRFCVSRAALSVLGMPKLGHLVQVVEDCAFLIGRDTVSSLNSVVSETNECVRPSPIVMEQCQEALSCLYYLLQRFPVKFKDLNGSNVDLVQNADFFEMIVSVILGVLKSTAFTRDCLVAAGVSLCAALQVCLSPNDLGLFIIEGIFKQRTCHSGANGKSEFKEVMAKIPFRGDVYAEICNLSVLSRICLIRGILTAVSRTVLNTHFTVLVDGLIGEADGINGKVVTKTILYDGILPELCCYCENPIDSHFNFHALTVMQICLQQIKTSLFSNLTNEPGEYIPFSEEMRTRILRIIWNNLEDPLSQTVKQVHLVFDLFLDIQSSLHWSEGGDKIKSFMEKIGLDLFCMGPRCKGRYVPLALLTKRLGTKTMLDLCHGLLFETMQAYIDDDVCCAATSFLKCFLECLRDECWSNDGIENGYSSYRRQSLPPVLLGLASGVSKLRSNLNTYALPILLEMDVDSIFPLLAFISTGQNKSGSELLYPELASINIDLSIEQRVATLVSLLKVSRSLALIEGDIDWHENLAADGKDLKLGIESADHHALVCIKGIHVQVLVRWLVMALTHADETLRLDAAESLFLNPKTSCLPSNLELTMMREAVPLNMRCCSTAFQMKWTSLFRKFFSRVQTALERQFKQGNWKPLFDRDNEAYSLNVSEDAVTKRADDLFHFMRWLSCFLFFSCYPSAPYKRKIMAMDLILIMINVWSIRISLQSFGSENHLSPYSKGLTSENSSLLLVGSIVDSWDRLRESSFRILLQFPTPIPGVSSELSVKDVIGWAKRLICSPRVRESDAGALTLRLIFRKYVLELGCMVDVLDEVVFFCLKSEGLMNQIDQFSISHHSATQYIKSMINWLDAAVSEGERDLTAACKNSFVHGVLLALRYSFEELDWNSDMAASSISDLRSLMEKLLDLIMRIASLALWVVSADAWYLPEDMDEMGDDDNLLVEVQADVNVLKSSSDQENEIMKFPRDVRSSEQIVMVGCWLAMKEVSLLLGTIIRKIPLPSSTSIDLVQYEDASFHAADISSHAVLDLKQLERIGNHFLEVLLKMKHNGAIDKTRAGFTALCNRLLCSNDAALCKLTEFWLERLMGRTVAKGQVVDDLLRRSAGIPAAFTALFLAEPEGMPKKLLPLALRWLVDVASGSLLAETACDLKNGHSCKSVKMKSNEEIKSSVVTGMDPCEISSKIRDEGVIPIVHAFNVLRAAFNDTNLAVDTSGFSTEALIVAIRSFSSPYWEVRNSACLAYTALVRRMIGFLNVQKRESVRRALTGLEFFHRYPLLHSFLINELEVATKMLGTESAETLESNLARTLHPHLYPILILLSRLKPSQIATETGDHLDPFLFMPLIRRCSIQSNLRVRVLASRALSGLVSNEKLSFVLSNIASELPCDQILFKDSSTCKYQNEIQVSQRTSFNSVHGILLQLSSLLESNCRNLADCSKKDIILGELVQILIPRSWIGNPRLLRCPIINTSFLRVLNQMLDIARTYHVSQNFYSVRRLLLELSTGCLDLESSSSLSHYDPTCMELREQSALSYFSCVFQPCKDVEETFNIPRLSTSESDLLHNLNTEDDFPELVERLISCLSDSSYEVRLTTLKWLQKYLKATESSAKMRYSQGVTIIQVWAGQNLHATLVKLLAMEKNHRCIHYILRIVFIWNLLQFEKVGINKFTEITYIGNLDGDSVFQFWRKLISLYKESRHAKTREIVICCMGLCIKRFALIFIGTLLPEEDTLQLAESDKHATLACLLEYIVYFTNVIRQHSESSEMISMRKAAAESLMASGLLEQSRVIGFFVSSRQIASNNSHSQFDQTKYINLHALQILELWFTCIKLLEDEDDGIRLNLSRDVQKCYAAERYDNISLAQAVPTQVDKVIRFCFDHLTSIYGHWIEYFNYLAQWVLDAASYVTPKGDLVRRVFDKEIDNHYEEKLFITQICCTHLEKFPSLMSEYVEIWEEQKFINHLCQFRVQFRQQLVSFAEDHIEKQEVTNWIGGVGNHKDAFLPLYSNLLGFYALSNRIFRGSCEDAMHLMFDIVEIGKIITPFLTNPLIANLYVLTVKLHDKFLGDSVNPVIHVLGDDSIYDGFDPYFLLR